MISSICSNVRITSLQTGKLGAEKNLSWALSTCSLGRKKGVGISLLVLQIASKCNPVNWDLTGIGNKCWPIKLGLQKFR